MYVCLSGERSVVMYCTVPGLLACVYSTLGELHVCADVHACQSVAHLKLCSRVAVQVLHTSIAVSDQLNRVHYVAVNIHKA